MYSNTNQSTQASSPNNPILQENDPSFMTLGSDSSDNSQDNPTENESNWMLGNIEHPSFHEPTYTEESQPENPNDNDGTVSDDNENQGIFGNIPQLQTKPQPTTLKPKDQNVKDLQQPGVSSSNPNLSQPQVKSKTSPITDQQRKDLQQSSDPNYIQQKPKENDPKKSEKPQEFI